jgi:hypothetical protein
VLVNESLGFVDLSNLTIARVQQGPSLFPETSSKVLKALFEAENKSLPKEPRIIIPNSSLKHMIGFTLLNKT